MTFDFHLPQAYPRERWRWYSDYGIEGQVRFDNDCRLADATKHVLMVGVALVSPDPDVLIADRRLNPTEA